MISRYKNRKGFTLVELLVAITLFAIVISIAIGGFVQALRAQRQIVGLMSANSNASLALEAMAREMRTGKDFQCDLGACSRITFVNAYDETVTYSLENEALYRNNQKVVADNVRVAWLVFSLFPDTANYPPRITIALSVGSTSSDLKGLTTNLQTTVSSRAF